VPWPLRHGFGIWAEDACEFAGEKTYFRPHLILGNGTHVRPSSEEGIYEPTFTTDFALHTIETMSHDEAVRPFLVVISWRPPHEPFHSPSTHANALANRTHARDRLQVRPSVPAEWNATAKLRSDTEGYFASTRALDHEFGRLIEGVDSSETSRSRIIVFTSDHGELLGAHGRYGKAQPYDESARVPLFVRVPQRSANVRRASALVWPHAASTVDIAPTLLGLAGLARGSSLCGGCDGGCADGLDLSVALRACVDRGSCAGVQVPHLPKANGPGKAVAAPGERHVRIGMVGRAVNSTGLQRWMAVVTRHLKMVAGWPWPAQHAPAEGVPPPPGMQLLVYNMTADPFEISPFVLPQPPVTSLLDWGVETRCRRWHPPVDPAGTLPPSSMSERLRLCRLLFIEAATAALQRQRRLACAHRGPSL